MANFNNMPVRETFADPTFDITFKMLFGNDNNKDILISLLNSLFGFEGERAIVDVQINANELPVTIISNDKSECGISGSIDIICTNVGKQKIAVEMQRENKNYFLAREQEYMAKLIAGQVKTGEGHLYHQKVLETYILVICKKNIFTGKKALKDEALYEIDIQPMTLQTHEIMPDNKMFWKFFELFKFQKSSNYKKMTTESPLKDQWLEFLIDCSKHTINPKEMILSKKATK